MNGAGSDHPDIAAPAADAAPRAGLVLLFSGHMIDAPERDRPRFPPDKTGVAAAAIAATLDRLGANDEAQAICGGACGGDLLFAEAALARGCRVDLHLQFAESDFLQSSVAFAGPRWVDRYYAVKANPRTRVHVQPAELGPPPPGVDPYVRNNRWQLETALARGADKLRLIALWNGEDGKRGGTGEMVATVRREGGQVAILDSEKLFGLAGKTR